MKYVGETALAEAMRLIKAALNAKPNRYTKTATLTAVGWTGTDAPYSQTVSVSTVTASRTVVVSPDDASRAGYAASGCYCSAQSSGTLTFCCTEKPDAALTVNVLILT